MAGRSPSLCTGELPMVKIADIREPSTSVNILAKIVSLREAKSSRNGSESIYHYGILGDETGTIQFTAWSFPSSVREGDIVELRNCSARIYNDRIRITVGSGSEVVLMPEGKMEVKRTYEERAIKDLKTSDPYVTVTGVITGVSSRETEIKGEKVTLYSGFIDDGTARVRISSFGVPLKEGLRASLRGARVTEFNGRLSLTVGRQTEILEASEPEIQMSRNHLIWEVTSPVGNVSFSGIPVFVGERSGIVTKCSECGRFTDAEGCRDHPDAEKVMDLSCYFTLEDGTGSMSCYLEGDTLKEFLGFSGDLNSADPVEIHQLVVKSLECIPVRVTGDLSIRNESMRMRVHSIGKITDMEISQELLEGD
ncbi:MAG: replication factor A [Candidatus Thermoplasmatota archaeon]|nr:replication factor A [Candidatus Thermoplasmatota archaeon]